MSITKEVLPFIGLCLVVFLLPGLVLHMLKKKKPAILFYILAVVSVSYMLWFFRDPHRTPPQDDKIALSCADGKVMSVIEMDEDKFMNEHCYRVSIFLSLFDVHVNRTPFAGTSTFLGYEPGKRYFTFQEKSSEYNQRNAIMFENEHTKCLVYQIVGPIARRVVYWFDEDNPVTVQAGDKMGMMKFGSRLDMYLPVDDVEILVTPGERVEAGITPVARIISEQKAEAGE